jgi:hypothetical protein
MPSIHAPVFHAMLNIRRTENNVAPTSSDLQWKPVIGILAGFLSILLAVYILHVLFQFHASGVPHRVASELSCFLLMHIYELIYISFGAFLQALVVSRIPSLKARRRVLGPTFLV